MATRSLPAQFDLEGAPHRPAGHRTTTPAWSALLETDAFVYAQIGVQYREAGATVASLAAALDLVLAGSSGPDAVDRAVEIDAHGYRNEITMAYWRRPDEYRSWSDGAAGELFATVPEGEAGLWREALTISADRIQTVHSSDRRGQGVTHLASVHPTEVHEYHGAARDRIPAARNDELAPGIAGIVPVERASRGRRISVRAPENVCFIRSGQDWSLCGELERRDYLEQVAPALKRGTDYLRDQGPEAGCISGRFAQELGVDRRPTAKTCFLGFFVSLGHLERWAWSHPTHEAIYSSFMEHVARHGGEIDLALWGESSVLPSDAVELEYLNCHPQTGFLAYGYRDSEPGGLSGRT